ncbi:hypothetical protein BT67DRAFT_133116 [Trichocladium antarcticum]|uniref:Amidoligase enzyme n=1 Tax=Trichocladium antarcticum TaxID=1450529 RepID=A0AAN6ZC60_9PEZI|nr:hypothetical protein BT67DRAFT_133116 [Trichocladium antarcticum]
MPHIVFGATEPAGHRHGHRSDTHRHETDTHRHRHQPERRRAETPDFRFCVELGLVIRSRRRDHKTSSALENEISTQLTRAGIANHVASTHTSPISSQEWTIAGELCIPSRPRDHHFGIKLTSPFHRFSRRPESWQASMHALLDTLNTHFELTTTHQCYTHLHIVPTAGYWSLAQAKGLAKSALYFERCLDALVPPYRRRSVWAKSNRNNRYFAAQSLAGCFARIDGQATFGGLAARMNWTGGASPTGLALGVDPRAKDADFGHDTYRWGFQNLNREGEGFGTVAFRQPPGATSGAEVVTWIMLAGCLARLSCGLGATLEPGSKASLKGLGEWLLYEAEWSGMPNKGLLKDLIRGATPLTTAPGVVAGQDADVITIDDDQRLRWKRDDRDIAVAKYRRLLKIG